MRESKFKIEFMSEEQKEAFIVLSKEYMENLELKINCKDTPCMFALENYYIKEDRMEEIRVVRKLKDLDGLENGMGLYLEWRERKNRIEIKKEDNVINWFCLSDVCNLGLIYILDVIKAMGFKFEYKPMRTEQEVKKEILSLESLPFVEEEANYYVDYNSLIDKYLVVCDRVNGHGLYIYMSEGLAQKYADELNEIIGVGK